MENNFIARKSRGNKQLLRFLSFGFLGAEPQAQKWVEGFAPCKENAPQLIDRKMLVARPSAKLYSFLHELLTQIVLDSLAGQEKNENLALGISAGFDARAILMVLDEQQIPAHTYTFGEPGLLDFDLVGMLCEQIGMQNQFFNTNKLEWDLVRYGIALEHFSDYPLSPRVLTDAILKNQLPDRKELHGFAGDAVTDNTHIQSSANWEEAIFHFSNDNNPFAFQELLGQDTVSATMPAQPFMDPARLTFEAQLFFSYRVCMRSRPISNPGVAYLLPFEDPRWLAFWLNRPKQDLDKCNLYLAFLKNRKSDLFFDVNLLNTQRKWQLRQRQIGLVYGKFWGTKQVRQALDKLGLQKGRPFGPTMPFDLYPCYLKNPSFRIFISSSLDRLKERNLFDPHFVEEVYRKFESGNWTARKMLNGLVSTDILCAVGKLTL